MNIIESILTQNPIYQEGRKIQVQGLMLHSVGCSQPSAQVFVTRWNRPDYTRACVHGFIDANTGDIYQTLPWDHRGGHCGSGSKGSGNNTHIGVEMCEPASVMYVNGKYSCCTNPAQARADIKRTYDAAVELFAYLCGQYNLDPLVPGVIVSHKEGHALGIASNHGDPEHLWTALQTGYTMDTFRAAVKATMGNPAGGPNQEILPLSGKVKVIYKGADGLNVRTAPCMGDNIDQIVYGGTYTVTGISQDRQWYRLKSGVYITTGKQYVLFYDL